MKIIDIETTGLNASNSKILVFGIKDFKGKIRFYKEWEIGEEGIIKAIVKELKNSRQIIGYNIECFDLPFIIERAKALGLVKEAEELEKIILNKEILDIYKKVNYGSLQYWTKKLNISLKLPKVNGSLVPLLYAKQEFEKIIMHNYDDLVACEKLLEKL